MSEKRQYFINNYDWIRTGLMFEPRGHDMMSGSFVLPPHDQENDCSILFIETSGCLPMCGHGTIGTVTLALEGGLIKPKTDGLINIEVPAGIIIVEYKMVDGKVEWVKFKNVSSYLAAKDLLLNHPTLGEITFDVSYGGNFYAIIDEQENFSGIQNYTAAELIGFSRELRPLINKKYKDSFIHPHDETIKNVSHVLWTGTPMHEGSHGRNAVFYGEKAIDRSPCGTGTSARLAQLVSKGKINEGDIYLHESYIGSRFEAKVEGLTKVGEYEGIIPSIKGWARSYAYNTIWIDNEDPFAHGFQVI